LTKQRADLSLDSLSFLQETATVTLARLVDRRPVARWSFARLLPLLLVAALTIGCSATVQDKVMTGSGTAPGPVDEAKSLVNRYADGEQMGSEAMVFDDLVQRVTAADAGKGAKLKKFLDDAQKKGVDAAAAKALLKDL
jgi:hypothetical protein